jgi:hypothetical protein
LKKLNAANIAGLLLRIGSLGGRFVFIIFASQQMTPIDFGIYGIIASSSYLINQIVGLEAHQTTLRRVALQTEAGLGGRPAYGRFVALSAFLSGIGGMAFALWFGWSPTVIALSGAIVAAEYVGTEVTRILIVEGRSSSAQVSVSLRFVPWCFGWPIAMFAGFVQKPWNLELVLLSWLLSSVFGLLFIIPLLPRYFGAMGEGFFRWYRGTLAVAPMWLVVALCWRFLETGIRLVPAFVIDEATAGRYVFFANLASIGSTGLKAAIEPFWHLRMIQPESGARARHEFAVVSLSWILFGAALSFVGLWFLVYWGQRSATPSDWVLLAVLNAASGFLAMSQVPHFRLYAAHADKIIFQVSAVVLVGSIIVSTLLTVLFGLAGTAAGALIGCSAILGMKCITASRLLPSVSPEKGKLDGSE